VASGGFSAAGKVSLPSATKARKLREQEPAGRAAAAERKDGTRRRTTRSAHGADAIASFDVDRAQRGYRGGGVTERHDAKRGTPVPSTRATYGSGPNRVTECEACGSPLPPAAKHQGQPRLTCSNRCRAWKSRHPGVMRRPGPIRVRWIPGWL